MARPKLEDQEIDLNTIDQLNKSIDLGVKHNYRFQNGPAINIDSVLASKIKEKMMNKKPAARQALIIKMMESKESFAGSLIDLGL